jgi:transposase-like protein
MVIAAFIRPTTPARLGRQRCACATPLPPGQARVSVMGRPSKSPEFREEAVRAYRSGRDSIPQVAQRIGAQITAPLLQQERPDIKSFGHPKHAEPLRQERNSHPALRTRVSARMISSRSVVGLHFLRFGCDPRRGPSNGALVSAVGHRARGASEARIGQPTRSATTQSWCRAKNDDRDGQIRTDDPLLPKQVRYQAAPRPATAPVYVTGLPRLGPPGHLRVRGDAVVARVGDHRAVEQLRGDS